MNSACSCSTSAHRFLSRRIDGKSDDASISFGETPFQRISQIHSADIICARVSRMEVKLLRRSLVNSSAVNLETASRTLRFAQRLYSYSSWMCSLSMFHVPGRHLERIENMESLLGLVVVLGFGF